MALCLRDWHVFSANFERFQDCNFEMSFLEKENLYEKNGV